jgi:PAS domain S-box-containing protein
VSHSADQLRDFIDSIPTLAWSAVSDGSAESFNQRWLDYTGLSASEAAGWGWKAAIHSDDLSRVLDAFHRAREYGQPFEFEARLRRLEGTFRRFLMRGNPVRDARGNIVKWYGTNTDLEYFGRTLDEVKHWGTSDSVHPDDLPGVVAAWRQSVETATSYDYEHRLRRANGAIGGSSHVAIRILYTSTLSAIPSSTTPQTSWSTTSSQPTRGKPSNGDAEPPTPLSRARRQIG